MTPPIGLISVYKVQGSNACAAVSSWPGQLWSGPCHCSPTTEGEGVALHFQKTSHYLRPLDLAFFFNWPFPPTPPSGGQKKQPKTSPSLREKSSQPAFSWGGRRQCSDPSGCPCLEPRPAEAPPSGEAEEQAGHHHAAALLRRLPAALPGHVRVLPGSGSPTPSMGDRDGTAPFLRWTPAPAPVRRPEIGSTAKWCLGLLPRHERAFPGPLTKLSHPRTSDLNKKKASVLGKHPIFPK